MKKLLIASLVASILMLLAGCGKERFTFRESSNEVKSVEFVSAESSLKYTIVKTLSDTEKDVFLDQVQKVEFRRYVGDPTELYGDAIKITYQSENYEMISYFATEYVENGKIQYRFMRCGEGNFNNLWDKFYSEPPY